MVLPEEAAIFTDGRYTLQVRSQVDGKHWSYQSVPETSIADWLKEHAPKGGRIGYDPWLHTRDWVSKAKEALAARGAELVAVDAQPDRPVWSDRPEASKAHLVVQTDEHAGRSSADKRTEIGDWLAEQDADAAVLSALDSIAWAFNVRGQDVARTPVALAYAIVHKDGTADLFVAEEKVGPEVRQHLGNGVRLHDRAAFEAALAELKGKTVVVDPERAVAAIFEALEKAGAKIACAARPDDPAQGGQEFGRDRRPESRPGPRRRGHQPLPQMDRRGSAQGRGRRADRRPTISRRCAARMPSSATSPSTASRAPAPTARSSITSRARRPTASSRPARSI